MRRLGFTVLPDRNQMVGAELELEKTRIAGFRSILDRNCERAIVCDVVEKFSGSSPGAPEAPIIFVTNNGDGNHCLTGAFP